MNSVWKEICRRKEKSRADNIEKNKFKKERVRIRTDWRKGIQ